MICVEVIVCYISVVFFETECIYCAHFSAALCDKATLESVSAVSVDPAKTAELIILKEYTKLRLVRLLLCENLHTFLGLFDSRTEEKRRTDI